MSVIEGQEQSSQEDYKEIHQQPEGNPAPWIKKYLELADLLIKRARHKVRRSAASPALDAIGPPKQRHRP